MTSCDIIKHLVCRYEYNIHIPNTYKFFPSVVWAVVWTLNAAFLKQNHISIIFSRGIEVGFTVNKKTNQNENKTRPLLVHFRLQMQTLGELKRCKCRKRVQVPPSNYTSGTPGSDRFNHRLKSSVKVKELALSLLKSKTCDFGFASSELLGSLSSPWCTAWFSFQCQWFSQSETHHYIRGGGLQQWFPASSPYS